jgi:hypothetical protein
MSPNVRGSVWPVALGRFTHQTLSPLASTSLNWKSLTARGLQPHRQVKVRRPAHRQFAAHHRIAGHAGKVVVQAQAAIGIRAQAGRTWSEALAFHGVGWRKSSSNSLRKDAACAAIAQARPMAKASRFT